MSGTTHTSTTLVLGSSPGYLVAALDASPALCGADVKLAVLCQSNGNAFASIVIVGAVLRLSPYDCVAMTARSLVLVCPQRRPQQRLADCKQQQVSLEGYSIGTLASLRRDNIRHGWRALLAPFGAPEPAQAAAAACAAPSVAPAPSALTFPPTQDIHVVNVVIVWPKCVSCPAMLNDTFQGTSGGPAAQRGPSPAVCCAECGPGSALAQQQQELLQLLTPVLEQQGPQGQEGQEEECTATAGLLSLAADLALGEDQYGQHQRTVQQLPVTHMLPSLPHSKLPGVSYLCVSVSHAQSASFPRKGTGSDLGC